LYITVYKRYIFDVEYASPLYLKIKVGLFKHPLPT